MSRSLSQTQCDFACKLALLIQKAQDMGMSAKICELWRTVEQQQRYIADGKSKTMQSMHLLGLAADLALFKDNAVYTEGEVFRPLGNYWEQLGGRWGGRFGVSIMDYTTKIGWDSDHFELTYNANAT